MKLCTKVKVIDSQKMREIMTKRGFSQRGLSRAAKISDSTISVLLNGGYCGPMVAKKICDSLSMEFDDVFFVVDDCNSNHFQKKLPTNMSMKGVISNA